MSTHYEPTHDDLVAFATALHEVAWRYSDEPGEHVLDYFEKPHKWDDEFNHWRDFGGSLDKECLDKLEFYLDHKNEQGICDICGRVPSDELHNIRIRGIGKHEFEEAE